MRTAFLAAAALAATSGAAAPVDWARVAVVRIEIDQLHFRPDRVTLRAGRPYRLRVHNSGGKAHDLTSEAFFGTALSSTSRGAAPGGKLRLRGGETRVVRILPRQRGDFKFHSGQFGDDVLGLNGRFEVR